MLRHTFIHLPGISAKTEEALKGQGVNDWDDLLKQDRIKGLSPQRLQFCKQLIRASNDALRADDAVFFSNSLPKAEHWRAYHDFKDQALYLDLEIDKKHEVTVITLAKPTETRILIKGVNLEKEELQRALKDAKLLVTYNGASFDLPALEREYGITWKGLHVDLKTLARRQGYEGGLKETEKRLGITRDYEEKLDITLKGGDPALLYRMWRGSGDDYYLDLLLEYNEADAYNLYLLAQKLLQPERES
ncbi:MAG: ribonuclease H-like domain-containing protein [Candidatus Woesearchaeota archaeon]